jgi:dienelactone hydrolase
MILVPKSSFWRASSNKPILLGKSLVIPVSTLTLYYSAILFLICLCLNECISQIGLLAHLFKISCSGIEHAFTVWDDERYNERADSRSWREMATFLSEAFGEITYGTPEPDMTEVTAVDYDDDGFGLTGYLAIPEGASMDEKLPAVVIVPDWDGVSGPDGYEAHRATLLAEAGYIAFAADIYGSEYTQVEDFGMRVNLTGTYRSDYELFVSRIQAAVNVLANHELVDAGKILMLGYCFGGTGVVNYAFSGLQNVKAVVPFHGGLTSLAPIQTDVIYPYVLVESGGEDDAHGNNTELEMSLNNANATWEITRYSSKLAALP